jgi:4'-phosphopantetheinyl transferase
MPVVRPKELAAHEVHIWTMPTHAAEAALTELERVVGEDEQERASRFHFRHLRDSFVVTHGVLRCVLAGYLDLAPQEISFAAGARGKPGVSDTSLLQFNLTHSDAMAAIAVMTDCAVGIDLERLRPIADMEEIARRYFCAEEAAEILGLPADERDRAFFRCWTRKEAYIKAIGDGLSCPLDSFQVTIEADAQLVHIAGDRAAAAAWTLHDLPLAPGYIAAVAYRDRPRKLSVMPIDNLEAFCELNAR